MVLPAYISTIKKKMTKFKNKKNGHVIEENLIYYVDKLKKNNNFEEIKEDVKSSSPKKDSDYVILLNKIETNKVLPQNTFKF